MIQQEGLKKQRILAQATSDPMYKESYDNLRESSKKISGFFVNRVPGPSFAEAGRIMENWSAISMPQTIPKSSFKGEGKRMALK